MVSQTKIEVAYPLPPDLPPKAALAILHRTYEPLMRVHPFSQGFKRRPISVDEVVDDPFFRADGRRLEGYHVVERVPLLPGVLHRDIDVPVVFQSVDGAVRCRAWAPAGVRVRSVYEFRPSPDGQGNEIHETALVECSSIMKRFVTGSFVESHEKNLKSIVEILADTHRNGPQEGYATS